MPNNDAELRIGANIDDFVSAMRRAQEVSDRAMAGIESSSKLAANAMHAIGAAALGISAGVGLASIKSQIDGVIASSAKLKDMAEVTGASVEGLSALGAAAKRSSTDMDFVKESIVRLDKALVGADDASKGAGAALKFIGLSGAELRRMDPAEAVKKIADHLAEFKDGAGKSAIAMEIFGKSGASALPFLKELAEQGGLSAKVTSEQAEAADHYEKSIAQLEAGKNSLYKTIAFELLPSQQKFVDSLIDAKGQASSAKDALQSLVSDGSLRKWADEAAEAASKAVSGSVEIAKSLYEHREAVEAISVAYASWKVSQWLTPIIDRTIEGTKVTYDLARSFMAAKSAQEAQAAATVLEARTALAATEAEVAHAMSLVRATEGHLQQKIVISQLNPALEAKALAENRATAAALAHAEAMQAASVAGIAMSGAGNVAKTALAALGGPIGLLTTALTAGAIAWSVWGDEASDAASKASGKVRSDIEAAIDVVKRLKKEQAYGSGDEGALRAGLEQIEGKISYLKSLPAYQFVSDTSAAKKELNELQVQGEQIRAQLADVVTRRLQIEQDGKKPLKSTDGFKSRAPSSTKETAMPDVAKEYLNETLQASGRAIEAEKRQLQDRAEAIQMYVSQGYLSQFDYYTQMDELRREAQQKTDAAYQRELDALQEYQAKYAAAHREYEQLGSKEDASKQVAEGERRWKEAANKIQEVMDKRSESQRQYSADATKQWNDQAAAVKQYQNGLASLEAKMAELHGDTGRAAAINFDLANQADIQKYQAIANSAQASVDQVVQAKRALEEIAELRSRVILNASTDFSSGAQVAFNEYVRNASNAATGAKTVFDNAFRNMEDALVSFAQTGKLSFRSFADLVVADIARMQIRQWMSGVMSPITGGVGGVISGLFGSASSVSGQYSGQDFFGGSSGVGDLDYALSFESIPGFSVGTDYVPKDMIAMIHEGERIVPKAFNPTVQEQGGGSLNDGAAISISMPITIDARGADSGVAAQMDVALAALEQRIYKNIPAVVRSAQLRNRVSPTV